MSRLSDKAIFKGDENCGKKSGGRSTFKTAHCEIGKRNGCDAQCGWDHSHCNIGHVFVDPTIVALTLSTPAII